MQIYLHLIIVAKETGLIKREISIVNQRIRFGRVIVTINYRQENRSHARVIIRGSRVWLIILHFDINGQ